MFVHEVVLEGLLCSQTVTPVGNLMIALRNMNKYDDFLKSTPLHAHFDVSETGKPTSIHRIFVIGAKYYSLCD